MNKTIGRGLCVFMPTLHSGTEVTLVYTIENNAIIVSTQRQSKPNPEQSFVTFSCDRTLFYPEANTRPP
jgi:hypothetical protein